jgi:hypothetical protein
VERDAQIQGGRIDAVDGLGDQSVLAGSAE